MQVFLQKFLGFDLKKPFFSGIIMVARAEENSICEIDPAQYFDEIVRQVYIPTDPEAQIETFDLIDSMAKRIKFFRLECNMDKSAADTSFSALK